MIPVHRRRAGPGSGCGGTIADPSNGCMTRTVRVIIPAAFQEPLQALHSNLCFKIMALVCPCLIVISLRAGLLRCSKALLSALILHRCLDCFPAVKQALHSASIRSILPHEESTDVAHGPSTQDPADVLLHSPDCLHYCPATFEPPCQALQKLLHHALCLALYLNLVSMPSTLSCI